MGDQTRKHQHNTCDSTTPRKHFSSPFPSLRISKQLNHGGNAIILAFPGSIVLKCPIRWDYDDGFPEKAKRGAEIQEHVAAKSISIEKQTLDLLRTRPHPNIIQALLIVPEGIFLPRMWSTLDDRIISHRDLHYPECYIDNKLRFRWTAQITSAAAWLEHLGYAHGDLTPRNILLDWHDNIKLSDLGECVCVGEESQCGAPPYVPWVFETRDHQSEQYAIGWTIYSLYNNIPETFESPEDMDAFQTASFPDTSDIVVGVIIRKCWRLQYQSILALDSDIQREVAELTPWHFTLTNRLRYLFCKIVEGVQNWMKKRTCLKIYTKLTTHNCSRGLLDYKGAVDEMPKPLARNPRYDP